MENKLADATSKRSEVPVLRSPELHRISQGLRIKQFGLVVVLATPLIGVISCLQAWEPMWLPPIITLFSAGLADFCGRVLVWTSRIGDRLLIGSSVVAQAIGLISAVSFSVAVPSIGLPIGLLIAAIFQVIAALTFTNYLADLGRYLGDAETTQTATRVRYDIFAALGSGVGMGLIALPVVFLVVIVSVCSGYALLFFALPIGGIILLMTSVPVLYFVAAMLKRYGEVHSQIRATISAASSSSDGPLDQAEDSESFSPWP